MNYADRVNETTTATSMASITLLGAVTGNRPFNTPPLAVGVKRIPVLVVNPTVPGEWEAGMFTLSATNQLTRDYVLTSSNNNQPVAFSAGTKQVTCCPLAYLMACGLTNPDDVGFDIVLGAGQSNMQGNPAWDPLIDVGDPGRVFQWADYSADSATYRKIITGVDPLYMPSGIRTGFTGLATWAAKAYLGAIPQNRKVLLIPCAVGSTGLVGSFWEAGTPGGTYYERAITETNLAITAALLLYPNSRFVGTLWAQGEADGLNGTTQAQYAAGLKAVIAGFRSRITGAANSWFVMSGMTPEGIAAHTGEVVIDLAHTQVAAEVDKCVKVAAFSGYASDVHWTAQGARMMGTLMGLAVERAKLSVGADVTPPTVTTVAVSNALPTKVVFTFTEALDPAYVPALSAFTISGHTPTGTVAVSGNSATVTTDAFVNGEAARTGAYTQPGANNLRDLAGNLLANFSGVAITNNVQAVDVTPPQFSSAQVANASPTVIQITMNEALNAAVVPAVGAFTASGGRTVTGVSILGAVVSVTVNTLYANTDTITVSYTNPGSGNRLQDAAGNFTASFGPATVTNNVGAVPTAPATMSAPVATGGDASASVAFVMPADGGSSILDVTVTASTGQTATGASSPLTVTGLTNGTAVSFTAKARNAVGTAATASPASNSVTPAAVVATHTTFNPADKDAGITLSNGNLTAAGTAGFKSVRGVAGKSTGKLYVEYKMTAGTAAIVGMGVAGALLNNFPGSNSGSFGYYTNGAMYWSNAAQQTNTAWAANDIIGMALDLDNKTIQWFKNNVAQGTPFALKDVGSGAWVAGTVAYPMVGPNGATILANFGASAFTYTPPAGFAGWTV